MSLRPDASSRGRIGRRNILDENDVDGCSLAGNGLNAARWTGRGCIYRRILVECASGDAPKSSRNLRERGFDFEFATQIFDATTPERVDSRRDYGERRMIALGKAQDIALTVVYTDRAKVGGEIDRRIISGRKSSRREREAYKKATTAK